MVRLLNTTSTIFIWLVLIIYNLDSLRYFFGFQFVSASNSAIIVIVILLVVISVLTLAGALIISSPSQLSSAKYNRWFGIDLVLLSLLPLFFLIIAGFISLFLIIVILLLLQVGIVLRYPAPREEEKQLRIGLAAITASLLILALFTVASNLISQDPLVERGIWMIIVGILSYSILKTNNALKVYDDHIISIVSDDTSTDDLLYAKA